MPENVSIKETQPCQRELSFRIPAEVMARELDAVYADLGKSRQVRGFRPGKVPRPILEGHFGDEARAEALKRRIGASFSQAVKENDLPALGDPQFSEIKWERGGDLEFKATVDIRPAVEPRQYRGIHLTKRKPRVEEKEVEEVIASFRERSAAFETVADRPLQEGDWALLDYRETGSPEEKWTQNRLLEIKSVGREEIASQLIGMKPGETRQVKVRSGSPRADQDAAAGQEVELAVKLKEIKKKTLPELNDELAQTWGQYKDLSEVRNKVRESILQRKEEEISREMEEQVIAFLLSKNKFPLPPAALRNLQETYFSDLKQRRDSLDSRAAKEQNDQELQGIAQESAAKDMQLIFLLEEVARREKIEVDPKDLGEEVSRLAQWHGADVSRYRQDLEKNGQVHHLEGRLRRRQVLNFLIKEAKIKEVD